MTVSEILLAIHEDHDMKIMKKLPNLKKNRQKFQVGELMMK